MQKRASAAAVALLAALALAQAQAQVPAPAQAPVSAPSPAPPMLIVVLSVDQFRFDYIDRFAPWLSDRGFRHLQHDGANFTNAFYPYANTFTAPGHAAIGTGMTPAENGIVGNTWFERTRHDDAWWEFYFDDSGGYKPADAPKADSVAPPYWWQSMTGSPRYCVIDTRTKPADGKTFGMSPESLGSDALADRLKERDPRSRIVSVAIKDRAAILMGGRKADAAYWFDNKLPGFVSSSYYRFDPKLFAFNHDLLKRYLPPSGDWRLSGAIPEADLARITFDPPEAWPLKNGRYGSHFPHTIPTMKAMTYTPYATDMLLDFAAVAVETEQLGTRDGVTDLFFVSISSTDYVGHYYGPDSMEVAENFVLTDRAVAKFLGRIEAKLGDRVVVAVTGDHGVQPNPDVRKLREPNLDAGRLDLRNPWREGKRIDELPPVRLEIERQLAAKLEVPFDPHAPMDHALVAFFEEPALYLNWPRIAALQLDGEQVKRALRDLLLTAPFKQANGIDRVFTNTELLRSHPPRDAKESEVRASFRADRAGDVLIELRQNWIWTWGSNNTTHGQPLPDDQHVPLILFGSGIKPGRYDERVSPTDLARTLGALLGVDAGGNGTRVLPCIR